MLSFLHVLQLLFICVVFVSGCFITNCPPGGKRSDTEEKTHQCEQCGPPGLGGRCYGPQICCSPQFGCLIGGSITSVCQQESRSPSLCHNQGTSCDGSAETGPINGQCAALGLCCTPETCTMDEDCTIATLVNSGNDHHFKSMLAHHLADEPENGIPLVRGPVDAWFYRRLIHSKAKLLNGADGKAFSDPEVVGISSSSIPQGPNYFPAGPPKLADYF